MLNLIHGYDNEERTTFKNRFFQSLNTMINLFLNNGVIKY